MNRFSEYAAAVAVVVIAGAAQVHAAGVEGFTEPFQSIDVAAAEPGLIVSVVVEEGDRVSKGQILANLDQEVLKASLAVARAGMEAKGQLQSAKAELRLKKVRLVRLTDLRKRDHASQEEVDRAQTEMEVSEARVQAAEEALLIKEKEFDKIMAQLDRRLIRSPIDGVVTHMFKDEGEFVAPTDPVVMTVVQLDPLLATFSVSDRMARRLTSGDSVTLKFEDGTSSGSGTVIFVSPVTDAQSSTVRVKVRLPNADGKYRSGQKVTLNVPTSKPARVSRK